MASIEEANLLFKNLVTYEKSVAMAKKYVKYHKAVIKDLKRLEQLEKALDILKRFNFTIFNTKDNNNELAFRIYTDSLLETQPLNKEEYLLLKEVLGNES